MLGSVYRKSGALFVCNMGFRMILSMGVTVEFPYPSYFWYMALETIIVYMGDLNLHELCCYCFYGVLCVSVSVLAGARFVELPPFFFCFRCMFPARYHVICDAMCFANEIFCCDFAGRPWSVVDWGYKMGGGADSGSCSSSDVGLLFEGGCGIMC